jgi:hypothetical protein
VATGLEHHLLACAAALLLGATPLLDLAPEIRNPGNEAVALTLELFESEQARRGRAAAQLAGRPMRPRGRHQLAELALETGDLVAQGRARRRLVAGARRRRDQPHLILRLVRSG